MAPKIEAFCVAPDDVFAPPKVKSVVLLRVSVAAAVLVTFMFLPDGTMPPLSKPARVWLLPFRSYAKALPVPPPTT